MQNGKLRAQRKLRGWSQEDLVRELVALGIELGEKQLGVTRSLISRWECGVTHPRAPYPKLLQPADKYRALVLADLAMSHLPTGEVEESVRLTAEAFDIGSQLGSYRVLQRVREVRSYLSPYRDVAAVRDLDERMAGALGGRT